MRNWSQRPSLLAEHCQIHHWVSFPASRQVCKDAKSTRHSWNCWTVHPAHSEQVVWDDESWEHLSYRHLVIKYSVLKTALYKNKHRLQVQRLVWRQRLYLKTTRFQAFKSTCMQHSGRFRITRSLGPIKDPQTVLNETTQKANVLLQAYFTTLLWHLQLDQLMTSHIILAYTLF